MKRSVFAFSLLLITGYFFTSCLSPYSGPEEETTITITLGSPGNSRVLVGNAGATAEFLDFEHELRFNGALVPVTVATASDPLGLSPTPIMTLTATVTFVPGANHISIRAYGPSTSFSAFGPGPILRAVTASPVTISSSQLNSGLPIPPISMTSAMEVNNWAQLVQAMGGPPDGSRAEIIFLRGTPSSSDPWFANSTITINRPIHLVAVQNNVLIERGFIGGPLFTVNDGGQLTLNPLTPSFGLTLDGLGIGQASTHPLILVDGLFATLIMHGMVHLQNNHNTDNGGAVRVQGGAFNMYGGIIGSTTGQGNKAQGGGGVLLVGGSFNMSGNASVCGNEATSIGGGVFVTFGAQFSMDEDASVRNNIAHSPGTGDSGTGGGVAVSGLSSLFEMRGSAVISGNEATGEDGPGFGHGGGVYVEDEGRFRIRGGRVNGSTEPSEPNIAGGFGAALFADSTAAQVVFSDLQTPFTPDVNSEVIRNNTITGAGPPGPL